MAIDQTLKVCELFYSIQGESSFTGLPCFFIRLSGCNLDCCYCDSVYAREEPWQIMTIAEIINRVNEYPDCLVEITGGEPLLQNAVLPLMKTLVTSGRTVLLETNGSLPIDQVPVGVVIIMDMKCPDSKMSEKMGMENLDILTAREEKGDLRHEVKFVISSKRDFNWAAQIVQAHNLEGKVEILFSPAANTIKPAILAELILQHKIPARIQLQLHTLLWPGKTRGV